MSCVILSWKKCISCHLPSSCNLVSLAIHNVVTVYQLWGIVSQEWQGITWEIKVRRELGFKFYFKVLIAGWCCHEYVKYNLQLFVWCLLLIALEGHNGNWCFVYWKILAWGCRRRCQNAILVTSARTVLQASHRLEPQELDTATRSRAVTVCVMSEQLFALFGCMLFNTICLMFIRILLCLWHWTVSVCRQCIHCCARWVTWGSGTARTIADSWHEQIICSSAILYATMTSPLPFELQTFIFSSSLLWFWGLVKPSNC